MQTNLVFLRAITLAVIFWGFMDSTPVQSQSRPSSADNHLVLPAKKHSIPFYWQGDSVDVKWEPHTAILIPVKLKNCPKQFFMQFDLGSPYSLFYKNKLAAIQLKYPQAIQLSESEDKLINFSFKAGGMTVEAREIVVKQFDSTTIDWKSKKSVEIIGTIGADFIDNKVAVIDYPEMKLTLSQAIPKKLMPNLVLNDFIYAGRRVLLPAKIQGKQTLLYFDTGSSMYELLTDKKTSQSLATPDSKLIQNKVKSWDKYLTANSLASNGSIEIAGIKIPLHYSTYMEGVSSAQAEHMKKIGIGGMTGNKLFINYSLLLDTKNKKFGLIQSGKP